MTRPFAALERFLERLLERPAARLFRAPLQPVQLQRRLERMMDAGRVFSADRTYVPNRYRIALNPADFAAFETYQGTVEGELAEALHQKARARGYRLLARPEVTLVGSERVAAGDIHVTADLLDASLLEAGATRRPVPAARPMDTRAAPGPLSLPVAAAAAGAVGSSGGLLPVEHLPPFGNPQFQPIDPPAAGPAVPFTPEVASRAPEPMMAIDQAPMAAPPEPPPAPLPAPEPMATPPALGPTAPPPPAPVASQPEAATALYPVPPANAPLAIVEIRTLAGPASEFTFSGGSARVGRAFENEIVLPDDRVSRRHGQLTTRHGALVYSDLGSTNGSFVNGVRVSEIALGSGDVVRLGNSTLTIKPHH